MQQDEMRGRAGEFEQFARMQQAQRAAGVSTEPYIAFLPLHATESGASLQNL